MESLLCNEVWLMSPYILPYNETGVQENDEPDSKNHIFWTKEDCEEALFMLLRKEDMFMPERGYLDLVENDATINNARFKSVTWIIKAQRRMNLSVATVFLAVNYLDRFVSFTGCKDWKCWMFDLLSVACLSIASKFNETTAYSLHEFQVDFVGCGFAPAVIQRMELTVMKALAWRMDSTTPFSYLHILMIQNIDASNKTLVDDLTNRTTKLLLTTLFDPGFLEFKHCVVATSALRSVLESLSPLTINVWRSHVETFIPQDQKDNLIKCRRMMMAGLMAQDQEMILGGKNYSPGPSSLVTVLKVEFLNFQKGLVDLSFHVMPEIKVDRRLARKRKREEVGFWDVN